VALTEAVSEAGAPAPPQVVAGPVTGVVGIPAPRRRRSFATRRQKIMACIIVVGSIGFLLFRGLTDAVNYYLPANQAVAQRAKLGNSDFRIQGKVLRGVRQSGKDLYFTISSHHVNVPVVSTGSPPQLFRAGMPVVLVGHWQGTIFSSFQIMVQHGSSYAEAHRAAAPGPRHTK
jgi:cytochrome c-type biogenesis protein CcmE